MINCHCHLFNHRHVPTKLLQLYVKKIPNFLLDPLGNVLQSTFGNTMLGWITNIGDDSLKRYANFLKFGYHKTLEEQFLVLKNAYPQDSKFVVLMQDFQYISDEIAEVNFEVLKQEVYALKDKFPSQILPFHFIEPRKISYNHNPKELLNSMIQDISQGKALGLKMYPAEGYFPFDYRMKAVYEFAQENSIPITTHVSSFGSRYVKKTTDQDRNIIDLNGQRRKIDLPDLSWIYFKRDYTGRSRFFSDPKNYVEVLQKYPKLKICLAHGGAEDEYKKEIENKKNQHLGQNPKDNWYRTCLALIDHHENVYMDISFSLSDTEYMEKLIKVDFDIHSKDPIMIKRCQRLLFGTDYYMTYTNWSPPEKDLSSIERDLWTNAVSALDPLLIQQITIQNPNNWLKSRWYG